MKNAFENSQKGIESKNIDESKKYFEKYIANTYLKEFEFETEKKFEFKISLTSKTQDFAEEFMDLCNKFMNNFKSETYKIIIEFDVKENNQIEHINFIVIGKTGVGKSTFINEALRLDENKRAEVGKGEPITHESSLYSSDKLKMIRMWDTQGLDYNNTLESILNEITRLVKDGLDKGPDNYINIILYCTKGDRFENGDGQLISKIMDLYPFENLPVIITQLQSYFKEEAIEMEGIIRNILKKYEPQKADKIEIRSIVAQDQKGKNVTIKAYGIPELLRLSFDIMGRSISSATCKKISDDIIKLCKDDMGKKILFVQNFIKYEMEILEVAKNLIENNPEEDDDDSVDNEEIKVLSEDNIYRNVENPNYFFDNFIKIINDKFIQIFNFLENENIPLDNEENENNNENIDENNPQENNIEENQENENNNIEQNNINENINQDNNQNENDNQQDIKAEEKKEEESDEEEEEEESKEEEEKNNQENEIQNENEENEIQNQNAENEIKGKPGIIPFIEKKLKKFKKILGEEINKIFGKIFNERFDIYFKDLLDEQTEKNREYGDNTQLINKHEVEKNFHEKLFPSFKNEFFKISLCIILKLFMSNLKEILDNMVEKELKENENIINKKAENSLKNITEMLKKKLIAELDELMEEQK